jgi:hypothetical protein
MKIETLSKMRPCAEELYLKGFDVERIYKNEKSTLTGLRKSVKNEIFKNAVYVIICELMRLNFTAEEVKDALEECNRVNKNPLNPSEVKNRLFSFVDYCVRKNKKNDYGIPRIGCGKINEYGLCLGERTCTYHNQKMLQARNEVGVLPFNIECLEKYLTIEYEWKARHCIFVVKAIRKFQLEKNVGDIILIGMRTIADFVNKASGGHFEAEEIKRFIAILICEGVIEKPIQGQSGTMRRKSNGYRFLPWNLPQDYIQKNIQDDEIKAQFEKCTKNENIAPTNSLLIQSDLGNPQIDPTKQLLPP